MKILSRFKDYYDSISHQYMDKKILYIRDPKVIEIDRKEVPEVYNFEIVNYKVNPAQPWYFNMEIIGFCGKLVPVVTIATWSDEQDPHKFQKVKFGFYTIEEVRRFVKENRIPIEEGKRYRWFYSYSETLDSLARFLESTKDFNKLNDFFRKYNVPAFSIRMQPDTYRSRRNPIQLVLNPMLRNYAFAKVKDPFSAHQDLYQYVGAFLSQPEREMIQISDLDRLHKHGFDKWSFRKPPKPKGKK